MRAVHVNYFVHMHFSDEDDPTRRSLQNDQNERKEHDEHSECNCVSGIVNTLVHLVCRLLYKRQKK